MEENKSLATEESVAAEEVVEEVAVTEDTNVEEAVEEVAVVQDEDKKPSFGAKVKEWFRKKIVNLKRKPQNIPLVFYVVTSLVYLIALTTYSQIVYPLNEAAHMKWTGLCLFINTLLSILIIVSFLNSFPKRKKPSKFFIILTVVMTLALIGCDVAYYLIASGQSVSVSDSGVDYVKLMQNSLNVTIAHIVLVAISAVVFALLPVYTKLIRKIDTSIKVESATENMAAGSIDIQED